MPAPWSAGAELSVYGEIHGQTAVNVWHFATNIVGWDNPQSANDALVALATAMLDCFVTNLLPIISSDFRLIGAAAKGIHPDLKEPVVVAAPANSFGGGDPTNNSFTAILVNLRTGQGGRRGRGKKFLPPPGDDALVSSNVDGPTLIAVGTFLACVAGKFLGANPTTDWRLGVLSKTDLKAAGGSFDNAFRIVTTMTPSIDQAVMTSRRKGRGI